MSQRVHKVAGLLKVEISDILRTKIKDPRVGFITVMNIVLSKDLKIAKVYVSVFGSQYQQEISMKGLEKATPFIQNELGYRVRLRYVPQLHFYLDDTLEYRNRIDSILHDLDLKSDKTEAE